MIKTKIISSLSRVFIDSAMEDFTELTKISALKGERISFQLVHQRVLEDGDGIYDYREMLTPKFTGELAKYITVREVKNVGVELPIIVGDVDEYYERTTPGLYPGQPLTDVGRLGLQVFVVIITDLSHKKRLPF